MGAQFSRFVIFGCFFVFLGDPSKIAVLPAWELNSLSTPPQDNKKKHKKTPELYQKASPKCEPRTWSLRIAQDDPRWSNMAQDGSKMAQDGPSNSRV